MRLITTWFGTFIMDDEGQVLENTLFPMDAKEIARRLGMSRPGVIYPARRGERISNERGIKLTH